MKKIITTLIASILLALMAFFVYKAYINTKSYEEMSKIIVEKQNITQLSKNKLKKFAQNLSLGLYSGYEELIAEQKRDREIELFFKQKSKEYAIYFAITLLMILLLYFVVSLREFTILISLSGIIALVGGLITPIMMMSIHKEVEYLGDVVLTMESKGVFGSIEKLFDNQEYIVGGALLLFSIILPLLKSISILFVAIFIDSRFAHNIVHIFKLIGKWSMADVFVVATFLVYFSASDSQMSRAEIEVGLYLFLSYVIVSIIATLSADRMLRE
jgi:hypothetical protein